MCRCGGCLRLHLCSLLFFFLYLLDRDMYPGTFAFHLHLFLISCKYLLIFVAVLANLSIVLVMGDSLVLLSLARDHGYFCTPACSCIFLLNFHHICPVSGLCGCSGCSGAGEGTAADSSNAPVALHMVAKCRRGAAVFEATVSSLWKWCYGASRRHPSVVVPSQEVPKKSCP